MKGQVYIRLSREEMATASQGASMRWQLARAAGVANQKHDDSRDDAEIDLVGIKAEIAVAKAYSLHHQPLMSGIDDGIDMFAGDIGIDVKAAFSQTGNLLFKRRDAFRADVSVLVAQGHEEDIMIIQGWVSKDRFLRDCEVEKIGGTGRALFLSQDKLAKPETLWRYIVNTNMGVGT